MYGTNIFGLDKYLILLNSLLIFVPRITVIFCGTAMVHRVVGVSSGWMSSFPWYGHGTDLKVLTCILLFKQ